MTRSTRHAGTFLLLGLALAGCPGPGDDGPPDVTPDAGAQPDAGGDAGGAGLVFRFASDPSLPGELEGEHNPVVENAALHLVQVRVIGDSSPGGEGTRADSFELSWEDGEHDELRFPQAPPGIYSQLLAEIESYEIVGTVEISGEDVPFRIAEGAGAGIQVALGLDGLELEPGMDRVITIRVDLGEVIAAVDWDEVPADEGGRLRVSPESSDGAEVRQRLADSFEDDEDSSGPGSGDGSGDGSGEGSGEGESY